MDTDALDKKEINRWVPRVEGRRGRTRFLPRRIRRSTVLIHGRVEGVLEREEDKEKKRERDQMDLPCPSRWRLSRLDAGTGLASERHLPQPRPETRGTVSGLGSVEIRNLFKMWVHLTVPMGTTRRQSVGKVVCVEICRYEDRLYGDIDQGTA